MLRTSCMRLAGLVLISLAMSRGGFAQLYGLSTSAPGTVYRLNPTTGAATKVVDLTGESFTSLVGFDALNGTLYASDVSIANPSQFRFGSVDLATGAFTVLNSQLNSANWLGLAGNDNDNILYAWDGDRGQFVSVQPDGTATVFGPVQTTTFSGLAYDRNNDVLYAAEYGNPEGDRLCRIDTTTGAVTGVGLIGFALDFRVGLTFDPDFLDGGRLYMEFGNNLYSLSTTGGAASLIGPSGIVLTQFQSLDGLAFIASPIPEPGNVMLGSAWTSATATIATIAAIARHRRERIRD